jgi:flagellar motor switch protein FliM
LAPDSDISRLARLEQRLDDARAERDEFRRQFQALGTVTTQYAVLQSTVEELRDDIREERRNREHENERRDRELEARLSRWDVRQREWAEELSRRVQNQLISCSNEVAQVRAQTETERKELIGARRNLNLAMIAGVFAIAASLISSIVPKLLGGG